MAEALPASLPLQKLGGLFTQPSITAAAPGGAPSVAALSAEEDGVARPVSRGLANAKLDRLSTPKRQRMRSVGNTIFADATKSVPADTVAASGLVEEVSDRGAPPCATPVARPADPVAARVGPL